MLKVYDKEGPIKAAMERVMGVMLPDDANVVFASIENFDDAKKDLEAGMPVIFYGFDSEASVRYQGKPAVPWFYSKNAAYFRVPFELVEMVAMYKKIVAGEKIENPAVKLAARFGYRHNLIGKILHDMHYKPEENLKLAKKEFGITGSIDEIRAKLNKLREASGEDVGLAKEVVGDKMIPGVFCDVEGTLILNDRSKVNSDILSTLEQMKDKPVTLWTGGDVKEVEKVLIGLKIRDFPVVGKNVFKGCEVEIVYDDLDEKEFQKQYGIKAKKYIRV
mgnify:CR=1 FL=1